MAPERLHNRFIRWSRLAVFDRIFAGLAVQGSRPAHRAGHQDARSIERAHHAHFTGDEAAEERANAILDLETLQALIVVTALVLEASTIILDAPGAPSTPKSDGRLRNARALSSHDPRIDKDRIVGSSAVNGTPPPYRCRIGLASGRQDRRADRARAW